MRNGLWVVVGMLVCCAVEARAHEFQYRAVLSGGNANPANASPAVGDVLITTDLDEVNMRIEATFSGLVGQVTRAQIHGRTSTPFLGTAGAAVMDPSLAGFPTGVLAGSYDGLINLGLPSTYTPSFTAASGGTTSDALNGLVFGLDAGQMYFQIDTTAFPNGEISGFLVPVPEPGTVSLLAVGAGMLMLRRRRVRLCPN